MASRRYIGVVVSALLIVVLLLVFTDPWSTLRKEWSGIVLKDPGKIDRIDLWDSFDSTTLARAGDQWLLFGNEEINPTALENLLYAAQRIQVSSVLSAPPDMEGGTRIRFSRSGETVMEYELLVDVDRYMIRNSRNGKTCFVSVPGFAGLRLERVFSAASNHYRQHILIDLLPSEIATIRVDRGDGQSYWFRQDREGNLEGKILSPGGSQEPGKMDELAVRLLLSYFTAIRFEERTGIGVESLSGDGSEQMIANLNVESHMGEKHSLRVYPYREKQGGETSLYKALVAYNDDPEALLINYLYLDVLMRDQSHYFRGTE
jgi:hypothetical protein